VDAISARVSGIRIRIGEVPSWARKKLIEQAVTPSWLWVPGTIVRTQRKEVQVHLYKLSAQIKVEGRRRMEAGGEWRLPVKRASENC
jgi:hypothetical protein